MPVTLIDPEHLIAVPLYHQVAVGTGTRHVHIAGQVAWDEQGRLVAPDDLAGQIVQVHRNIAKALAAAGATFDDVVRVTWYAAGWKREMYGAFTEGIDRAREEFGMPAVPAALIGVEILFEPGILVEAEVTAIIA
jgi:YD repeat-containing protein